MSHLTHWTEGVIDRDWWVIVAVIGPWCLAAVYVIYGSRHGPSDEEQPDE